MSLRHYEWRVCSCGYTISIQAIHSHSLILWSTKLLMQLGKNTWQMKIGWMKNQYLQDEGVGYSYHCMGAFMWDFEGWSHTTGSLFLLKGSMKGRFTHGQRAVILRNVKGLENHPKVRYTMGIRNPTLQLMGLQAYLQSESGPCWGTVIYFMDNPK